jgi:hypothetical protein
MKTYNEIDANAKRKQYSQNIKDVKNAKRRKMYFKNKGKKQKLLLKKDSITKKHKEKYDIQLKTLRTIMIFQMKYNTYIKICTCNKKIYIFHILKMKGKEQHDDINMQKIYNFPSQIRIENNMLCLEQFNNFMKNVNFKFNCCVCNEKKFMQDLIICHIIDINTKLENMKNLFKFNPKHHIPNDNNINMIYQSINVNTRLLKLANLILC